MRWTPIVCLLTSVTTASAQQARPTQSLGAIGQLGAIASEGEVTAIAYRDNAMPPTIQIVVSDGLGVAWGAPIRVDQDVTGSIKRVSAASVAVHDGLVYVSWADARTNPLRSDLFLNVYDTATGTLAGEARVATGLPVGMSSVSDWDMAVDATPIGPRVYFGMLDFGEFYVTSTVDAGASFAPVTRIDGGVGSITPQNIAVAVYAGEVHAAWSESTAATSTLHAAVRYRRSVDEGASFGPAVTLDASGLAVGGVGNGFDLAIGGSTVAVAWVELPFTPTAFNERLHVNVSTDGGVTFVGDQRVGQYDLNNDVQIRLAPHLCVEPDSGNVVVSWVDFRDGTLGTVPPVAWAATSTDGGATWGGDVRLSPAEGVDARAPRARTAVFDGESRVAVSWSDYSGIFGSQTFVSSSDDGGVTWNPPVPVIDYPGMGELAYNRRYGNYHFVHGVEFPYSPIGLRVGGFRPATLTPLDWNAGTTSARFELSGFSGRDPNGFVFLSSQPGSLVLPFDGRDFGLLPDGLFAAALSVPGAFSAGIAANGVGQTAPMAVPLTPGFSFYAMGFSFDANLQFGELTDVVPVVVP